MWPPPGCRRVGCFLCRGSVQGPPRLNLTMWPSQCRGQHPILWQILITESKRLEPAATPLLQPAASSEALRSRVVFAASLSWLLAAGEGSLESRALEASG